jgi:hypothetical protein
MSKFNFTDQEIDEQRKQSSSSFIKAINKGMAVFQPVSEENEHNERHRECVRLTHDWCMMQSFFSLACIITDLMDTVTAQRLEVVQFRQLLTMLAAKPKEN